MRHLIWMNNLNFAVIIARKCLFLDLQSGHVSSCVCCMCVAAESNEETRNDSGIFHFLKLIFMSELCCVCSTSNHRRQSALPFNIFPKWIFQTKKNVKTVFSSMKISRMLSHEPNQLMFEITTTTTNHTIATDFPRTAIHQERHEYIYLSVAVCTMCIYSNSAIYREKGFSAPQIYSTLLLVHWIYQRLVVQHYFIEWIMWCSVWNERCEREKNVKIKWKQYKFQYCIARATATATHKIHYLHRSSRTSYVM